MTQVLNFMDFALSAHAVQQWRNVGIRERYREELRAHSVAANNPLFLDSGGFKLLYKDDLDLSEYQLSTGEEGQDGILALQRDLCADFVATLDYPLPPGLEPSEAQERMDRSYQNAIRAAHVLEADSSFNPFLYVASHGQGREGIASYVSRVFTGFADHGVERPFGLAIGSLVPLRGSNKDALILDIVAGAIQAIPNHHKTDVPVHVFGVTGTLIPLLAYLGVDTFDSSTFVQEARSLSYLDTISGRYVPILDKADLTCDCRVCSKVELRELQTALTSSTRNKVLDTGHYKSKYYADLALHNLEMDYRIVELTRCAIQADELKEFLISHIDRFPKLQQAAAALATNDIELRTRLSRKVVPAPSIISQPRTISLSHKPDDFNILVRNYSPPRDKDILLLIPCSEEKPYSSSRTHKYLAERMVRLIPEHLARIHWVTISGLYGPVPEEFEEEKPCVDYDYRLDLSNKIQTELVANRIVQFLTKYDSQYGLKLAYVTSAAYRTATEKASHRANALKLLPKRPRSRTISEFFRADNVSQISEAIILHCKASKE